ncbi:MAG: hypothetical protein HKN14_14945 [Marinicaulis sp.]|nr:hypothetical protein [Marinicaulis sp.]NNL89100.1 hypothetical protein [Marinicaulis sp.]
MLKRASILAVATVFAAQSAIAGPLPSSEPSQAANDSGFLAGILNQTASAISFMFADQKSGAPSKYEYRNDAQQCEEQKETEPVTEPVKEKKSAELSGPEPVFFGF